MRTASRAAALAALLAALAGCGKEQDAALLVTVTGPFLVPSQANRLTLDVFEGSTVIRRATFDLSAALPQTVTIVQSGADHPSVKLNAALYLGDTLVGLGTVTAAFQDGQTVEVTLQLAQVE
jgi:hypothetical protein